MIYKTNIWLAAITFLLALTLSAQDLPVVPQPQEVKYLDGEFSFDKDLTLKIYAGDTTGVMVGVNELQREFEKFQKHELALTGGEDADIIAGLKGSSSKFDKICKANDIAPDEEIGEQGYKLSVTGEQVVIAAKTKQGLFYGLQTLKLLMRSYKDVKSIPAVWVKDYPDMEYRGVMDDISRGPVPTMDFMKYQIRRLSELKINLFHHYIEHVVKTEKHGDFAPSDGSLSIEQWKEITAYAKKYYVTVLGGFQSFGHFTSILNNPRYAKLGESGSLISPVLPESVEFLEDIYKEMIPAFSSDWFAINCDETFDLGRGYSKEQVDKYGYAYVYKQHIMNLYNIVKKMGKKTIIWGDIMLKYPELLDELPKDMLVGTWVYDGKDSFDEYIKPFIDHGFTTIVCPGVLNSNKVMPEWNEAVTNIHNFIRDGVKYNTLGELTTVWDDGGFTFFSIDWYGVTYSANQGWNSSEQSLESFNTIFNKAVNADTSDSFTKALWKILEIGELTPTGGMTQKVVWVQVVPDKYESINISLDEWDRVLELCNEAENLLDEASPELYKEQLDYFHFVVDLYKSLAQKRFLMLEAANNYKGAAALQSVNKDSSRTLLVNALNNISEIKLMQQNIAEEFRRLWLAENHTYSMMKIIDRFEAEIDDIDDMQNLVFDALKQFDSGLYMPTPQEVRLAVNEVSGKFFREWMMVNPLPNTDGMANSKIDYLADMGGEKNAHPKVTQEFYYNGEKYRWRRVMTNYFDVVNLVELFPDKNTESVMYAHCTIDSPVKQTIKASLGSDDGATVFVNGEKAFEYDESRTLIPDENTFDINLNEGRNDLLIKVSQLKDGWGFTFRLPESKVRNSKNRYYIQ